jgi:flagellar hook-associated protein 3 FlgL
MARLAPTRSAMANLVPIPSTRVSSYFVRQRLLAQLQGDQVDIFRLQNQISTGRRITLPSEDAPAAQRAVTLQRLIERKNQLRSNVESGQFFLGATDEALNDVASKLGEIRGIALGAASTTATAQERLSAVNQVDETIDALLATANKRFRGRYLFAGSQTNVEPYSRVGNSVRYNGNDKLIENFSDLDVLFSTNAPGHDVFGGISDEVLGGVDLDPHLSADTLLSSLRGGLGISPNGAVQISDGANSVVVDISRAVTVGDVVRLIEENPPAGRAVTASVTGNGLTLQLDSAGGGNLTVTEVGSGKTASELGILEKTGVLTNPLVGDDVDPAILKTTRLGDLLGSKARTRIASAGDNNDLLIEAAANGATFNGVAVQFVDDVAAGAEFAAYDSVGGTLTVHIAAGATTANTAVQAINTEGTFTAKLDPTDTGNPAQAGSGLVSVTATSTTAGGSGATLDLAGIQVDNGGQSFTLDFSDAETVEDLLNILNGSGAGLHAEINADRTGINIRSRLSGSDFWIRENGGQTAAQLGIRLDELNHPIDVPVLAGADFTIRASDGAAGFVDLDIDLAGANTVQAILDAVNNHPLNNTGGIAIQARLTTDNAIELEDLNGYPLIVREAPGGETAQFLGLVAPGGAERYEQNGVVTGVELHNADSGNVFNTLLRLREALVAGDVAAMGRAIELIDEDIDRSSFARAEVGAREQALQIAQRNLEDEDVQLESALSNEIDVDLVEAISNLTARQASLQASLQTMASILQLSLLDFI